MTQPTSSQTRQPICYGQINGRGWTQEHYETATHDACVRAKELRAQGYRVTVVSLGTQVTSVGYIKMTMVDVRYDPMDQDAPLRPERLEAL